MLNQSGKLSCKKTGISMSSKSPVRQKSSGGVNLKKPQIGASGIEYAVIAGLIVVAFVGAFIGLGLDQFFIDAAAALTEALSGADFGGEEGT